MFRSEGAAAKTRVRRPDGGGRSTVYGTRGAVSCEHPLAAVEGLRVLDEGGTAADACVAMAACLAVVAPMTTGMGGDAFLLFYEAGSGRVIGANGSGRAPRGATIEGLRARGVKEMPERGGLSVTVPGAVRLWEDAARRLGKLPLGRLLEPARRYAEEGFPVTEVVSRYWEVAAELLGSREASARCFLPGGRAPRPGEVFRQPDLARTLALVAESGSEAFYGGEVARSIARAVQEDGGYLSEEDLAAHETTWVEPISTGYRGLEVHEIPPPGQGIAALEMLNILEGFDMGSLDPSGAERIHLEVEAKKLAFRDLFGKVGDPEFAAVPVEELLSKDYAARLREEISPERAAVPSVGPALGSDTTYLCAVDAGGNGCSFINSLYMGFGSGVVADGTGVCLQNRGRSFRLVEGHPNALAPGKRPMHTIIPGLVTRDGALWAVFGVMGGPMQPQGHAQLLSNLIDHRMEPQEAVDHPRHFHDHEGDVLLVEGRVAPAEVERLRRMGHRVEVGPAYAIPTGGAQLIRVLEDGVRACGSDPRKDGCALAQ
ncbi:gamma-glutamyltransferase 2. Threonine peptidase. MEROPS family T03 [Rubrobacter xylanophilus DSM 9941]|uniref:Glutathione hydrolase proenzyme n=1 Tax=Rubrobacter xylanophilus (strain DSM 9941 / JCM 11954 / NBRC 16129 / PRD-1) TaxID=266117 RepID=Q1AZA7_RUBXD|nr:gamma-glutamyltransferase [Rubrobacter xylanophilus]ABG03271.1 gamma-glutamyltransferase 2. Threonine peptidase. MEROPS family T03 [Rubrobacter xylanophilus DSM 9941]